MAEWSKALALGASPKGRGFEPHRYQEFYFFNYFDNNLIEIIVNIYSLLLDLTIKNIFLLSINIDLLLYDSYTGIIKKVMILVGFEPTPFRTGA